MDALTPASPGSLPPLGEQIAYEPFWRYRAGTAGEGIAHLRVWTTAGSGPGHPAVVAGTGSRVTESAAPIWSELARWYGPSLMLLEHHLAPEAEEGAESLDLVRIGTDGSPHWTRIWPTRRTIPATPAWNCGWSPAGIRSSANRRAGSTRVKTGRLSERYGRECCPARWPTLRPAARG